jgi:hypothetical protein
MYIIKKYQEFLLLNESRSQEISFDQAMTFMEHNNKVWCPELMQISRGINHYRGIIETPKYLTIDPTQHIRTAIKSGEFVSNHYNLLVDNLPSWSKYPKRSKSLIGMTKYFEDVACADSSDYGKTYIVIPKDNVKMVICPTVDFITSFNMQNLIDDLGFATIDRYAKYLSDRGICDKSWKEMLNGINSIDSITPPRLDIEEPESRINYLDTVLNPYSNDFKLVHYNKENFRDSKIIPSRREIWTESECIIILPELIDDFYKEVEKLRIAK